MKDLFALILFLAISASQQTTQAKYPQCVIVHRATDTRYYVYDRPGGMIIGIGHSEQDAWDAAAKK